MGEIDLNYKLEGRGDTLVFIHGLSDDLRYWEFLASNLKSDYQVLRIDLRGHGQTGLGDDEISINTYADDLHGLLCELGIDNVRLIGFSLGGAVAMHFTIRYPQMVSSLVLMSTFCKADNHLENVMNQFKDALDIGFDEFYNLVLPKALCPDVIEENKMELEVLREIASHSANAEAYVRAIDASLDFDVEDDLSEIDVPALILAGRYDEIILVESQKKIHEKIENSRLIVFDNVRHNLLVGKNNERILSILKKEFK